MLCHSRSELRSLPRNGLQLFNKEKKLRQRYIPDFIGYDQVIVELKAVKEVAPEHKAQIINYLKVSQLRLGLLVNLGDYPKATITRLVL
jgi:GxxExxY protein